MNTINYTQQMKTIKIDTLLVPIDFTDKTQAALEYALGITEENEAKIIVAHFVNEPTEVAKAELEMRQLLSQLKEEQLQRTKAIVEVAEIKQGIDQIADRFNASAIVLGKHENSIFENIFGSKAIDLVESMHHPFIVLQHKMADDPITNILFAFNHQRESLQATQMVSSLAKLHGAKIHLTPYPEYDDDLNKEVKINEKLIVDHLMAHDIPFEMAEIPRGTLYKSMLISYAHRNDVDLMAAAYLDFGPESMFQSFIDDLLMYDPEIPLMTVNGPEVMIHQTKLDYVPS